MITMTTSARPGESRNVSSTGSTPAMYVPMTGRNWETSPTHSAIAIGAGVPRACSAIQWKSAESAASNRREYRYPPVLVMARFHVSRTRR